MTGVTGKISAFAPNAKIIHIDIDPAEISKNVRVDIPIVGDAKNVLKSLIKYVKVEQAKTDAWIKKIDTWKKEYPLTYKKDNFFAPVRCRTDKRSMPRCDHSYGGRAESDVGSPVLQLQEPADIHIKRRPGYNGLRLPCRYGRKGRKT